MWERGQRGNRKCEAVTDEGKRGIADKSGEKSGHYKENTRESVKKGNERRCGA